LIFGKKYEKLLKVIYIDLTTSIHEIETLLKKLQFMHTKEKILSINRPGEGNMNVVIRVITNQRSFILKQSRPFVQKYPEIKAPIERITVEKVFFEAIKNESINNYFPEVLLYDEQEKLIIQEDIVNSNDMIELYDNKILRKGDLIKVVKILKGVHSTNINMDYPLNLELRKLNYEHIFIIPFLKENIVESEIKSISNSIINDIELLNTVKIASKRYLEKGDCLLHGDYYPGSWLKNDNDEIFIIDPEFSFVGLKEFDIGVLCAHLIMITGKLSYIDTVVNSYARAMDIKLMSQFTGIEIIRRILGVAKLPMTRSIKEKKNLLDIARRLII
tara:strand:- start:2353 stop:3345 length:993 start_codon:yes stop_codon:yes gene_type:complete